jgi:hypothetical protein
MLFLIGSGEIPWTMKTSTIAGTAILAILLAGAFVTLFGTLSALTPTQPKTSSTPTDASQHGHRGSHSEKYEEQGPRHNRLNLTVGETLTFSGLTGRFVDSTNHTIRGNSSGSFTFAVTGAFKDGYTLSIKSGSFTVGSTTYTVTGGTVVLGPFGEWANGSGTTGQGAQFLIQLAIHGKASTNPDGRIVLDLKNASTEYLVSLGTAQP